MTKDELILIRQMLVNKKQIKDNQVEIKILKCKQELLLKTIGYNNEEINIYQGWIDDISQKELVVEKHQRLKGKIAFEISSYIFLIALFTNNMFFDTSFISYVLAFLTSSSFITYESLRISDRNLIRDNTDINFDNFDSELEKKVFYLLRNMDKASINNKLRSDIVYFENQMNSLIENNVLLRNENKELYESIKPIEFNNTKKLKYRRK